MSFFFEKLYNRVFQQAATVFDTNGRDFSFSSARLQMSFVRIIAWSAI